MKYALQKHDYGETVYFYHTVPRTGVGFENESRPIDGKISEEIHLWNDEVTAEKCRQRLYDNGYYGYKVVEVELSIKDKSSP